MKESNFIKDKREKSAYSWNVAEEAVTWNVGMTGISVMGVSLSKGSLEKFMLWVGLCRGWVIRRHDDKTVNDFLCESYVSNPANSFPTLPSLL